MDDLGVECLYEDDYEIYDVEGYGDDYVEKQDENDDSLDEEDDDSDSHGEEEDEEDEDDDDSQDEDDDDYEEVGSETSSDDDDEDEEDDDDSYDDEYINFGVFRNPPVMYSGGILSGPIHPMGPQYGLIPSPRTLSQVMQEQAKQRQLKGILDKLTPQNFERLFEQVKQVNIDNAGTLTGVISQIFDKALMEPTFCEMYANLYYHLADELPDFNEKITFRRLLLNMCQKEFERGEREHEEAKHHKFTWGTIRRRRAEEEGEAKQSDEEREEKRVQARRRMLGNIRLIGELYKKKIMTERIMHECIKKLLGQYQNPDEEDIEGLCTLMSTIGEMIDHPKAKLHMDAYFDMMAKLSNNMKLSSRVRFMLKDSIDLRKNKWQQRRKVEGPKKIEEVHRDAANERQAQVASSFGSETSSDDEEEQVEKREIWIQHYSSSQRILLVGEGNYSFSLSLAKAFRSARNIVATSLDTLQDLAKKYSDGVENVRELEEMGGLVLCGLDATQMRDHHFLTTQRFDRIVYNFPHVGFLFPEDNGCQIKMNKGLVKGFLRNAKVLLKKDTGEIHVAHKNGNSYDQWDLVKKAQKIGLVLHETMPFHKQKYPGYFNKRGQGSLSNVTFRLGRCTTYKFRLPQTSP